MSLGDKFLPSNEATEKLLVYGIDVLRAQIVAKEPIAGALLAGKKVALKAELTFHLEVVE